jgi:hypothetical protein
MVPLYRQAILAAGLAAGFALCAAGASSGAESVCKPAPLNRVPRTVGDCSQIPYPTLPAEMRAACQNLCFSIAIAAGPNGSKTDPFARSATISGAPPNP